MEETGTRRKDRSPWKTGLLVVLAAAVLDGRIVGSVGRIVVDPLLREQRFLGEFEVLDAVDGNLILRVRIGSALGIDTIDTQYIAHTTVCGNRPHGETRITAGADTINTSNPRVE